MAQWMDSEVKKQKENFTDLAFLDESMHIEKSN